MSARSLLPALAIGVIAASVASLAVASADDGGSDAAAPAVMLEPGDNFVGWIEEPIAVGDLFEAVPQIEVIFFWDAASGTWRIAAPAMHRSLWTLDSVDPGMALLVRNGTDQSVPWIPQTKPARGLLLLREGTNWVSWAGPDGWTMEQVVRGVGNSLVEMRIREAVYVPGRREASAAPHKVMRGDALEIVVARSISWPQPTDLNPQIAFPGGAPEHLRSQVEEDVASVLAFYSEHYGVQADPSKFVIVIPADLDALLDWFAYQDDRFLESQKVLWEGVPGWVTNGGPTRPLEREVAIIKPDIWIEFPGDDVSHGRYTISHEYAHVLQRQIGNPRGKYTGVTPLWLIEGTATWADRQHFIEDGHQTWPERREQMSQYSSHSDAPKLRDLPQYSTLRWTYGLGAHATDWLLRGKNDGDWLELFRHLSTTQVGPKGRWESSLSWQDAFEQTFELSVRDFYQAFEAYRQTEREDPEEESAGEIQGTVELSGRLVRPDDSPVAGVPITAERIIDGDLHYHQNAVTDEHGHFRLEVESGGEYALQAKQTQQVNCWRWNGRENSTASWRRQNQITVANSDVTGVRFEVDYCIWNVKGRVIGPDGKALAGVRVDLSHIAGRGGGSGLSSRERGAFEVTVHRQGTYQLSVALTESCFYPTTKHQMDGTKGRVWVGEYVVSGIDIYIPANVCLHKIRGNVSNVDEIDLNGLHVVADKDIGLTYTPRVIIEPGGEFSIVVPEDGSYKLRIGRGDCSSHPIEGGKVGDYRRAHEFDIRGADAEQFSIELPKRYCSYEVKGRLVDGSGTPKVNQLVFAANEDGVGSGADRSDSEGYFEIAVPVVGRYRIYASVDGCARYFTDGGSTVNREDATPLEVLTNDEAPDVYFELKRAACR